MTTTADELGRTTGFIKRQRQLSGSGFAQALVISGLAMGQPTRHQQQTLRQAGNKCVSKGLNSVLPLRVSLLCVHC